VSQDTRIINILEADGCREFKRVIRNVLQGLQVLKYAGYVHCDLKSENILVDFDLANKRVRSVKIIDFGTSFPFDDVNNRIEITTPEYLPPEILEFVEFKQMNGMASLYNEGLKDKLNI